MPPKNRNDMDWMMQQMSSRIMRDLVMPTRWVGIDEGATSNTSPASSRELNEAKEAIKELTEILERVKKEPLVLYRIDRLSKDGKHAFIKKGETDLRVEAVKDLKQGDEVLLHPKTFQIVEHLGKPPLEVSRFAPENVPDVKWDDIGGLQDAKADLIEAIELPHKNRELFEFYGRKQIKGILLSGPPGCGKTMLGKAAATSLATIYGKEKSRTGFLYVKGPEILNQYVGQTEQTIRDIFDDARRHKEEHGYPAIIFLDEADAILATRGTRNVGIGNTIVPMFLTEMDGLEESSAVVIIATNRPDVLDPAIVRDGRIDRKVSVTRPCEKSAAEILRLNLKRVPVRNGVAIEEMANETISLIFSSDCRVKSGLFLRDIVNGAMLANCVNLAVSSAIQRDLSVGKVKTGSGILMEDIKLAVGRILKQSQTVIHDLGA
jgi:proteasome ATPase